MPPLGDVVDAPRRHRRAEVEASITGDAAPLAGSVNRPEGVKGPVWKVRKVQHPNVQKSYGLEMGRFCPPIQGRRTRQFGLEVGKVGPATRARGSGRESWRP